jgi:hypothetical protein
MTDGSSFNLRRFLVLSGALGCAFFLVGFASTRYGHHLGPQGIALRGPQQLDTPFIESQNLDTGLDKTLLSSKSFKTQTIDLGHTIEEESDAHKGVTMVEHPSVELVKAPRHHRTREYYLDFEDDFFDSKDVEVSLSKALRSGKEDQEDISEAVSENLKHHKNFGKRAPSKEYSLKDKS